MFIFLAVNKSKRFCTIIDNILYVYYFVNYNILSRPVSNQTTYLSFVYIVIEKMDLFHEKAMDLYELEI